MIKIIKQGNLNRVARKIYTHTCENCGCVFEYDSEYIKENSKEIYTPQTLKCPCCNLNSIAYEDSYRIEVEK